MKSKAPQHITKIDYAMIAVALGFYDANECQEFAQAQAEKAVSATQFALS